MYIKRVLTSLGLIVAVLVLLIAPPVQIANAAALTIMSDIMSTVKASVVADHEVRFKTPTGVDASTDTITLTFAAGFTMGSVAFGDMDLEIDAACDGTYEISKTLAATPSTSPTWGAAVSGQIITLTAPTNAASGEIAVNACVRVEIGTNAASGTNQITNATAASYDLDIAGAFGDTGTIVITIVADDVVVTTATVVASLTFTVDDNTIFFGTLGTGAAKWATGTAGGSGSSTSAHTMTVGTNSTAGYSVTYNGTTLTSGGDTIDVATWTGDADGTPGSEQFAIAVTVSGDATIATAYQQASNNFSFVASTTTTLVSETVQTATETISAYYIANIAANTEAHTDYTSNITYIATGNF